MGKKKAAAPMDEKRFWDIIARACKRGADPQEWDDNLVQQLARLPPEEIVAWGHLFDQKTNALYTVDHWGAAYTINGGASDDGFYYFRCWLVGMGKKVYEAALADPDSLADVVSPDEEYEAEIYSVAAAAWEARGLAEADFHKAAEALGRRLDSKLKGRDWDFDDDAKVRKKLPRLAALYLDAEEE
jgi:hypothetical protein